MCSRLRYNFFQRLCHKAVYIRHYGGTREFQTPNHSSPQCADTTSWFVVTFYAFLSAPGKVGSGSVRPGSALCAARPGRGPHTAAAAGCREGALRQLCLLKTMLQVEQDHGTPTSVLCHFVCVFLKRKHKTLLTICQFQETGSWETGQIGFTAAFSLAKVRGQLCRLKTVWAESGWERTPLSLLLSRFL